MNLPIYRAKKIDSDEYIQGYLLGMWGEYFISWGETNHVPNKVQIDPTTLAIHFPDMLDSEGNKIFASLSEDGKGGDIVELEHIRYLEEDLNNKLNNANRTVALQMEGFDKMCEQYEGQLSVQDNEIKRLNVIKDYLESRIRECEIDME